MGDHLLDPGWTLYDKEALYVGFDLTPYIAKGENVMGIMLGNGFYNIPYDKERYFKVLTTFGAPKLKLLLRMEYRNGTVEHIVSDDSWKVTESPITFSSIYGGEDYDARREQALEGWKSRGYVEGSQWKKALTVTCDIALRAQLCHPVTVRETLKDARIFRAGNGKWVYDLGQNFSGIPRFTVRSRGSQRVILRPAELLNPDSTVNCAGGFIIQLMPGCPEETISRLEECMKDVTGVTDILKEGKKLRRARSAVTMNCSIAYTALSTGPYAATW